MISQLSSAGSGGPVAHHEQETISLVRALARVGLGGAHIVRNASATVCGPLPRDQRAAGRMSCSAPDRLNAGPRPLSRRATTRRSEN